MIAAEEREPQRQPGQAREEERGEIGEAAEAGEYPQRCRDRCGEQGARDGQESNEASPQTAD